MGIGGVRSHCRDLLAIISVHEEYGLSSCIQLHEESALRDAKDWFRPAAKFSDSRYVCDFDHFFFSPLLCNSLFNSHHRISCILIAQFKPSERGHSPSGARGLRENPESTEPTYYLRYYLRAACPVLHAF